jgi:hypothetical protein
MTAARIVSFFFSLCCWVAVVFSLAFAIGPLLLCEGSIQRLGEHLESNFEGRPGRGNFYKVWHRDEIVYDVLLFDNVGARVGVVQANHLSIKAESVKYLPLYPPIFVYASNYSYAQPLVFSSCCMVAAWVFSIARRSYLRDVQTA